MNIIECIESRRSVRKYSDKKVEFDTIKELIRLGTMAPTSLCKEPWGFVVIQDKEEINDSSTAIFVVYKSKIIVADMPKTIL